MFSSTVDGDCKTWSSGYCPFHTRLLVTEGPTDMASQRLIRPLCNRWARIEEIVTVVSNCGKGWTWCWDSILMIWRVESGLRWPEA